MDIVSIPHLALPFRIENGRAATVEQDTDEEVLQCVQVIVSTMQGQRVELPDFGIPDPAFTVDVDEAAILAELNEWEPRALILFSDQPNVQDELLREVTLQVQRTVGT
jgi:phage baseplate assembly protein W